MKSAAHERGGHYKLCVELGQTRLTLAVEDQKGVDHLKLGVCLYSSSLLRKCAELRPNCFLERWRPCAWYNLRCSNLETHLPVAMTLRGILNSQPTPRNCAQTMDPWKTGEALA